MTEFFDFLGPFPNGRAVGRQSAKDKDNTVRLGTLKAKFTDAENRLGRLYAAIEGGIAGVLCGVARSHCVANPTT